MDGWKDGKMSSVKNEIYQSCYEYTICSVRFSFSNCGEFHNRRFPFMTLIQELLQGVSFLSLSVAKDKLFFYNSHNLDLNDSA